MRVQWILREHKHPFTDGAIVKGCMNVVAETLLDDCQREEHLERVKLIPLSATMAARGTEIFAGDVHV